MFHCKKVAGCSAETNSRGFEGDDYRSRSVLLRRHEDFPTFLHSLKRWGRERNAGESVDSLILDDNANAPQLVRYN